ncbi:MAG: M48 family metalloprotease, partial [Armatimonadota bacterium]|nr:M48 family metalloprotease [Armatimonadota bacterium]
AATMQFEGPLQWHDTAPWRHLSYEYSLQHLQRPVDPIAYAFGYRPADLAPILGMLGLLLTLPVAVVLWMRSRALSSAGADAATAWFRYSRFLQWTTLGFILVWMPSLLLVQPLKIINFWLGSPSRAIAVGVLECFLTLPPLLVGVISAAFSYPVSVGVRGSSRTRRELLWQSFLVQARLTIPVALVVVGITAWQQQVRWSVLLFGLALFLPSICTQLLVKSQNTVLEALTAGDLRDRVFALAQNAGVKVQQLYFLKTGKETIANAFAVQGNIVVLTEYLLQRLSRREVDAIVAHELAHLRHVHPARLKRIALFSIILPCASLLLWDWHTHSLFSGRFFLLSGLVVMGVLIVYYKSRQFEVVADRDAAALTGDPEALITGLLKLKQLNLTPLEWGKWEGRFLTHPSTLRRAEALARDAGFPQERLQDILQSAASDEDHYPLPAAVLQSDGVYTTRWKTNYVLAKGRVLDAIRVALPLGAACAIRAAALPERWITDLYIGAFVGCAVGYIGVLVLLSPAGFTALKKRLAEKLERDGTINRGAGGILVGLSPAARPRLYGGFSDWDMGFLYFDSQRLTYVGEQAQFSLERPQISSVSRGAGMPGWFPADRLYVVWKDSSTGEDRSLSFRAADYAFGWGAKKAASHLFNLIQTWRESAIPSSAPSLAGTFGPPSIGSVTSASPVILRSFPVFVHTVKVPVLIAIGASIVVRLPFTPSDGSGGWFVLASVILLTAIQCLPYWKYREPKGAAR